MATDNTEKTLVQALAEFQKDLPQVGLDSTNPAYKSKYASLGAVTKAVFPKLTEHGFAFSVGSFVENGLLILDAHLIHESGESRSLQFPITETLPQKIGSAITYGRRYALAALTGVVADEDDDGNAASVPSPAQRQIEKAAERTTPRPSGESASKAEIRDWINGDSTRKATANSVKEKFEKEKGLSGDALWNAIKAEVMK